MPWSGTRDEISFISSICGNDEIKDKILYKNAVKLFNIEVDT